MTDNRAMHQRSARSGPAWPRAAVASALTGAAVALTVLASCSSGNPGITLHTTSTTSASIIGLAPITVTATVTVTTTVPSGPTVTVSVPGGPTTTPPYDKARALAAFAAVVADIAVLDRMQLNGTEAALQLSSLAKHFAELAANAAPPGLDPPSYYSRVRSLEIFATAASTEALAGSPQAPNRYSVIRLETQTLLAMVNASAQTAIQLPPPPAPTIPSATTSR